MKRIFIPTKGPDDWQQLLAAPVKQWRAGYSAHACAHAWEAANGLPPEIAKALSGNPELLLAIPEHKVALPGRGAASQCDVFALVRTDTGLCTAAIEAKVDEPFGPTIGEWLRDASPGKRERLAGLLDILAIDMPPPDIRYQLIHRTAAALIEARRFTAPRAAMLVHSFSATQRWRADYESFADLFPPDSTPNGTALTLSWVAAPLVSSL